MARQPEMAGPARARLGGIASVPLTGAAVLLIGCAGGRGGGSGDGATRDAVRTCDVKEAKLPAGSAQYLEFLTEGAGSLIVNGREADSLTVRYVYSADNCFGPNPVETIDKEDSLLVVIRPPAGSQVDLQLVTPEKLTVDLYDQGGREVRLINIENRVNVFVHEGGSLYMDDIEGPATIRDGNGSITINDSRGPLIINDKGGGIRVTDIKNSVRITTGAGDVHVENVDRDVEVTSGSGRLVVRDVRGKLVYRKSGSGEVVIEQVVGGVEKL